MLLIRVITVLRETGEERGLTNLNSNNQDQLAVVLPNKVLVTQDLPAQWLGQTLCTIWCMCFCLIVPTRMPTKTDCRERISEKIFSKLFMILYNQKNIL